MAFFCPLDHRLCRAGIALGLYRIASLYYGPGFNKPNGTGECLVSLKVWNALDDEMKAIIANACAAEADYALAEMERLNVEALAALVDQHHVQIKTFSSDIVAGARKQASDVLAGLARASEQTRKVHDSYIDFRERVAAWSRISLQAVIAARAG